MAFRKRKEEEQTAIGHLEELRKVFIVSFVAILVGAVACWFVADEVLAVLLDPVANLGHRIVFVGITEALMTKLKISLFLGFLLALPVVLWQVWSFILPALHKREKKVFTLFVVVSLVTFLMGISFCFFVIYRMAVAFLLRFAGPELTPMLTIGQYVSFTIAFMIPFGLVFQLPLVAYCLTSLGVLKHEFLKRSRKYAVLVILIIASLLTPADLLSTFAMGIPMYILFEASILVARIVERGKAREAAAEAAVYGDEEGA